jgi:hypothetical protein
VVKIVFDCIGGFYERSTVATMDGRRGIAHSGPIGKVKTGNVETRMESDPYLCLIFMHRSMNQ